MKRVDLRRVFVTAGSASLVIVYIVLWVRMISTPEERTGADFIAFFAAGRISIAGPLSEVYLPQAQQTVEGSVLGFPIEAKDLNPFVHPPFILPLLAVIALLPYEWAFCVWAFLLFVFYMAGAWFLVQIIPERKKSGVLISSILLFFPAFVSILNGQDTTILLLGASMWMYGLLKRDDRLAGIGLAVTSLRPHVALLLALPFLFRKQKVWWWFLGSAGVLVLFSVTLLGIKGVENYFHILTISASGEGYKINEAAMVNFLGLLRRLAPGMQPDSARYVSWAVYAFAAIALCIIWSQSKDIGEKQIGSMVVIVLFSVPHLHYHDLTLLIIPIMATILITIRGGILEMRSAFLIPLAVSLAFLFGSLVPMLKYNLPILVMAGLILCLWVPREGFLKRRINSNE